MYIAFDLFLRED